MKRLLAIMLAAGALAFAANTASAAAISVEDTYSIGAYTPSSGNAPTITTAKTDTSNNGSVTPLHNPHTQTLTEGTSTTGEYLFVVDPNGSGQAVIPVRITLTVGGQHETITDDVTYYAKTPDTDYLTWASNVLEFAVDGYDIVVSLPNETDWNMAQQVTFEYTGAVPEPASLALLGTALAGLGLIRYRRKTTA